MVKLTPSHSLALLLPLALATPSLAGVAIVSHVVDGAFGFDEWTITPTPTPANSMVAGSQTICIEG